MLPRLLRSATVLSRTRVILIAVIVGMSFVSWSSPQLPPCCIEPCLRVFLQTHCQGPTDCATATYYLEISSRPYGYRASGSWYTNGPIDICWTGVCIAGRWDVIAWFRCTDTGIVGRFYTPALWSCGSRYSQGQSAYLNISLYCPS